MPDAIFPERMWSHQAQVPRLAANRVSYKTNENERERAETTRYDCKHINQFDFYPLSSIIDHDGTMSAPWLGRIDKGGRHKLSSSPWGTDRMPEPLPQYCSTILLRWLSPK